MKRNLTQKYAGTSERAPTTPATEGECKPLAADRSALVCLIGSNYRRWYMTAEAAAVELPPHPVTPSPPLQQETTTEAVSSIEFRYTVATFKFPLVVFS